MKLFHLQMPHAELFEVDQMVVAARDITEAHTIYAEETGVYDPSVTAYEIDTARAGEVFRTWVEPEEDPS